MARALAQPRSSAAAREAGVHPLHPTVWFPFTEATSASRVDAINGLTAVPGNGTAVVKAAGITGFGARFDATQPASYLRVPSTALMSPAGSAFTVACWIFPTLADFFKVFWGKWQTGAPTATEWEFFLNNTGSRWQFNISPDGSTSQGVQGAVNSATLNAWNLVIAWWDPAAPKVGSALSAKVQVNNGAIVGANAGTVTAAAGPTDITFGCRLTSGSPTVTEQFSGTLCDPLYFNRVLNVSERAWLWNNGAGQVNTNLAGAQRWRSPAAARGSA